MLLCLYCVYCVWLSISCVVYSVFICFHFYLFLFCQSQFSVVGVSVHSLESMLMTWTSSWERLLMGCLLFWCSLPKWKSSRVSYYPILSSLFCLVGSILNNVYHLWLFASTFIDKASLHNVLNTTRILINPPIEEAAWVRKRLLLWSIIIFCSMYICCHATFSLHLCFFFLYIYLLFIYYSVSAVGMDLSVVPKLGPRVRLSVQEDFLRTHPKKTLAQLHDTPEDGTFVVYATVNGFVDGDDWWYPACKCHRSVAPDSGAYYCKGCVKHVFQMVPRYDDIHVHFMVSRILMLSGLVSLTYCLWTEWLWCLTHNTFLALSLGIGLRLMLVMQRA